MKPTYGKTAYFINSYMVCVSGEIEGIMKDEYILNTGKGYASIKKDNVFETRNEAIKDKISSLEDTIEVCKRYLENDKRPENPGEAFEKGDFLAHGAVDYYPDAIEFLKSQLEEAQEGF